MQQDCPLSLYLSFGKQREIERQDARKTCRKIFWRPKKRHALEREYCSIFTNPNNAAALLHFAINRRSSVHPADWIIWITIARLLANYHTLRATQKNIVESLHTFLFPSSRAKKNRMCLRIQVGGSSIP